MERFERTQLGFRSKVASTKVNEDSQGDEKYAETIDQTSIMC